MQPPQPPNTDPEPASHPIRTRINANLLTSLPSPVIHRAASA
jgi:hypothetical protein